MKERIFEGRLSDEIAQGDRGYRERLKAAARQLVGIIREGLVRDGHVRIHGFGSFRLRPMKARAGINPRTGERITIPARQRVLFRPAKALRERIEPERPRARPIAEPHASREASLGTGAFTVVRPWGAVPSAEAGPVQRPWRVPERPDTGGAGDEPHASREATLGGTMQEPHPAGALPPEADGEAAVAGDAAPPPAPPGRPDWDGARDVAVASAGAGAGAIDDAAAGGGGQDRRGAGRWGAAALLAVVLALLLWWLWPASQPPPRVAQAPATGSEPADDGAAQGDAAPAQAGEAGPGDAGTGDGAAAADDARETTPSGDAAPADTAPESDARADAAGAADDADRDGAGAAADADAAGDGAGAQRPDAASAEDRAADADAGGAAQGPEAIADAARAAGDTAGEAAAGAQSPDAEAAAGEGRPGDGDTGAAGSTSEAIDDAGTGATDAGEDARAPGAGGTAQSPAGAAETADERDPAAAPPGERPDVASAAATPETGAATAAEAAPDAPAGGGPYFAARAYTVRPGDTLWHLAARHYGNPYYWPHIWNHNEGLADPDVIRVDRQLRLPALEGGPQQLTAADRRSIAEGYLRLYRLYRARGHARPRDALVAARRFDASVLPEALRQAATARPGNAVAAATAVPAGDGR